MATTVPYGCAAGCYDGPDLPALLRTDRRGLYRRPSVNLRTGDVLRDPEGRVLFDEAVLPVKEHLVWCRKGYSLVRVV